jgi:hypothetical protein
VTCWRLGPLEESRSGFIKIQSANLHKSDYGHGGGGETHGGEEDRCSGEVLMLRLRFWAR